MTSSDIASPSTFQQSRLGLEGSAAGTRKSAAKKRLRNNAGLGPLLLVVPFALLFVLFVVLPIVLSLVQSFKSPLSGRFVGLTNYKYAIGLGDFWRGVERVIYFGVIQVVIMIVLALILALVLDSPRCRGRRAFTTIFFLPFAVPSVIAAIMWGFLLSPQLDHLLHVSAINPLNPRVVIYSIVVITIWEFVGYNMTLYLASLTSVSAELSDAAHIDGATEWDIAFRIKLPLIRRMIALTVILSILGSLQLFNEPSILSNLTPIGSSYTPNLLIYNTAFNFNNVPVAAAESTILAILIISGALMFRVIVRQRRGGAGPQTAALSTGGL